MLSNFLQLSKYRFTLEAVDKIILPHYKGSTFHGGFGHALNKISPRWYRYFFEAGNTNNKDWPKPFVILPPLDELESYPKGHQFTCELTLFGEATQHYSICEAAIEYLGMQMGLGYKQGRYKIVAIESATVNSDNTVKNHILLAKDIIKSRTSTLSNNRLSFIFPSRLRLKSVNRLHRQAPSFQLIIERLLGRLKTLDRAYSGMRENDSSEYKELIEKAAAITIENQNIHWDDWNRFSGTQKKWMKFGGLIGNISYCGDLTPFFPYLAIGEWIHIGNKTSFGFGKYVMNNMESLNESN